MFSCFDRNLKCVTLLINTNNMKIFFIVVVGSLFFTSVILGQNGTTQNAVAKSELVLEPLSTLTQPVGKLNYIFSGSAEDFKNNKYVFYTDSNATVAHLVVNGTPIRLTGGPNPEHIMAYTNKEYTVTLSINKPKTIGDADKNTVDNHENTEVDATIVVYDYTGHVLGAKVTGIQINSAEK